MDEENLEHFGIGRKLWISKEEAKKMWPDNSQIDDTCVKKWRYECYICGMKKLGAGELSKQCDCKHFEPKVLINVGK